MRVSDRFSEYKISIHAPTRGATPESERILLLTTISIHAPTRGATIVLYSLQSSFLFQSTLPRGERLPCATQHDAFPQFQSTLPRGERPIINRLHVETVTFQSTLPRGERLDTTAPHTMLFRISIHAPTRGATPNAYNRKPFSKFQSTLPRGERLGNPEKDCKCDDFNPRSHEGSDMIVCCCPSSREVFQSTLPRGERPSSMSNATGRLIFQSTLPRGERQ